MTELWSAARIAQEFGLKDAGSARAWLARFGVKHIATTGSRDTRLYDPAQVQATRAAMPGAGSRTDLRTTPVAHRPGDGREPVGDGSQDCC